MKPIFEAIAIILCVLIMLNKGDRRAKIYLFSTFFMPTTFGTAHSLLAVSVIVSLWRSKELSNEIKNFPLKNITLAILSIYFIISFLDRRLSLTESITRPTVYFIQTYFNLFVGFVLFNSSKGWLPIAKTLLKIFSIFALYGIFTWILQSNPWYDFTASVYEQGSGMWSEVQDRGYRVNSFLNNPIAYSLVMGIGASTIWLYYLHKPNKTVLILLLLIVFNVFIANSRTGIVAFGLSIMIYILFYNGISLKTAYKILCAIVVAIILYFNVESIRPMIDAVADIFITGGNNTSGSNMELKDMQMATSLTYFGEAPIFGHGILYFKEDIQPRYGVMSGLAGLEGYGYRLLIEMGGIMIIAFIMYITKFCSIAIKGRYQCKSLASLAIAQFIAFIFFIMATGDYGNIFEYSLILIGINLKHLVCELKPSTKRKQQTIWRQKTYSV